MITRLPGLRVRHVVTGGVAIRKSEGTAVHLLTREIVGFVGIEFWRL